VFVRVFILMASIFGGALVPSLSRILYLVWFRAECFDFPFLAFQESKLVAFLLLLASSSCTNNGPIDLKLKSFVLKFYL
jgi:hypothetical protein